MPVHFGACAAAAMGWASAQDCEDNDAAVDTEIKHAIRTNVDQKIHKFNSDEHGTTEAGATIMSDGRSSPAASRRSQSVRFSEQREPKEQQSRRRSSTTIDFNDNNSSYNLRPSSSSSLLNPLSVRSMTSERFNTTSHLKHDQHRDIRLRSIGSLDEGFVINSRDDHDYENGQVFDSFVGGDFSSGKVKTLKLETGCWVMSYNPKQATILAVGLMKQLVLLDTRTYTKIYTVPRNDKVSAISWCSLNSQIFQRGADELFSSFDTFSATKETAKAAGGGGKSIKRSISKRKLPSFRRSKNTKLNSNGRANDEYGHHHGELCAVAGLDGQVSVYHLNYETLEIVGTNTLFEMQILGQVRCIALEPFHFSTTENSDGVSSGGEKSPVNNLFVLAVGDKRGMLTLVTLSLSLHDEDTKSSANNHNYSNFSVVEVDRTELNISTYGDDDEKSNDNNKKYHDEDPILGLTMCSQRSILAATTKSGKVSVRRLLLSSSSQHKQQDQSHIMHDHPHTQIGPTIWNTQRNGAVRSIVLSKNGQQLVFGGYDKTVVLVDTNLWAITRELSLPGTINAIAFDHFERFIAVGCRDKSLTFYDTSTFANIKRFQTAGWVTSISWGVPGVSSDIVAIRSENRGISLLDLTPIYLTDVSLSSIHGMVSSVAWTPDGRYLARLDGDHICVTDSLKGFSQIATIKLGGCALRKIAFSPSNLMRINSQKDESSETDRDLDPEENNGANEIKEASKFPLENRLAAVGLDGYLHVLQLHANEGRLELIQSIFVEKNLWVVTWSSDGKLLAVGGKEKKLHIFSTDQMEKIHTLEPDGRIWDIDFIKAKYDESGLSCGMAVASGDYKTVFFDLRSMQPTLQVMRTRTVRCLSYHPTLPLLAMGDGAGIVAVVDYIEEETTIEFEVGGRVNVLEFSPTGELLLVGTDDCCFTLHETKTFKAIQAVKRSSFALSASFSASGKFLAVGSANENYSMIRMGPLLGIGLVPLTVKSGEAQLPSWVLKETLYRSGYGPSLLQRHMLNGSMGSVQFFASILKQHPDAVYTFNRSRDEGCFDTAIHLRKIKLLKLALTTLVDGTLESKNERRSILTTDIPAIGRATLESMLANHPPEFIVEILKGMKFVKVPFTTPHEVSKDKSYICASPMYLDPWVHMDLVDESSDAEYSGRMLTPAVLPLPNLGTMKFLDILVKRCPATAFDNEAMALVLRVMWQHHIRKYFILDTSVFLLYYILWIVLVDSTAVLPSSSMALSDKFIGFVVLSLNSLYAMKEFVEADLGRRRGYFRSWWNAVDVTAIVLVYFYSISTVFRGNSGRNLVPLAVVTSLLLTLKLLSYLRAFGATGWLVTVLNQNVLDVRGFLVVLLAILVGFSIAFRVLFAQHEPQCLVELEEDGSLLQECDVNPFGSLRRSFLATFELAILGSYDNAILYESDFSFLAVFTFVLAITTVLVVALNALISVLADSYARVQENASANRRKEKAQLIVEYLSLIPPWRRRQIEKNTKYFHALLEADEEGDLVIDSDDWRGSLNALREDMEEVTQIHADAHRKALEEVKADLDREISIFKGEVLDILRDLSEDVKKIQREKGVTIGGKGVSGAVKVVKQIGRRGTKLLRPSEKR